MKSGVDTSDLARVAAALKKAGDKGMAKELRRDLRKVANPIRNDMRAAVKGVSSSAAGVGGSRQRALLEGGRLAERKAKRGQAVSEKELRKITGRAGLRDTTARALKSVVRDSGRRSGVHITVDGTKMPAGQRYLPRGMDSPKGWRHPVFGTDAWVTQKASPPGWFRTVAKKHKKRARAAIEQSVRDYAARIDKGI